MDLHSTESTRFSNRFSKPLAIILNSSLIVFLNRSVRVDLAKAEAVLWGREAETRIGKFGGIYPIRVTVRWVWRERRCGRSWTSS